MTRARVSTCRCRWLLRGGCVGALLLSAASSGCTGGDLLFPAEDATAEVTDDTGADADGGCSGKLCGDRCVDLATDPSHCGTCGRTCSLLTPACVGGACACPASGKCGGVTCTDVSSNADDCGVCGKRCADGETCVAGACVCRPNATNCGGDCVDTRSDPANCGGCGKVCGAGKVCAGSACVGACGALTACSVGSGVACVDLASSPEHCGECGRKCDERRVCIAGECREYVGAAFCKACPCPACGGDRPLCCPPLLPGGNAICVEATSCPAG